MRSLRIALAQINPTVGDFEANIFKIVQYIEKAIKLRADIIAFPELSISGYPPEDLLLKPQFINDNLNALKTIQKSTTNITAIVGFIDKRDDIFNAAAIIYNKKIIDVYHKMYLPNYGVFDEYRYFQAGTRCPIYQLGNTWIGVNICEDIWYPEGPSRIQSLAGAEVIININASPYRIGKGKFRETMLATRATDNIVIIAYLNIVGGQDELIFDGHSMIIDQNGKVIARGKQFKEDLIIADIDLEGIIMKRLHAPLRRQEISKLNKGSLEKIQIFTEKKTPMKRKYISKPSLKCKPVFEPLEEIYNALVLGTHDYIKKNDFKGVVVGLSGGIDSSLVATIAVEAIGKHKVYGIFMPSPYTSKISREDAYELAENIGIKLIEVPIHNIFQSYLNTLKKEFCGLAMDKTEENIQARIRGNILMSFSNKFGWLVLTTGNKSEMSVGYATLYGDMAGGFAVLKDVPKTLVYELSKWKNKKSRKILIPERVLTKEPSAELKPGQKDSDTLPPYPILDNIIKAYVEEDKSFEEIASLGLDINLICNVITMIDKSEYKRRQSPPGIKITERAFGRDRRFPITNKYRGY
ncbi:MAG: NAD+ synthase [Nitrospirae bacterium]|nr:NAD+ synthase [Nitrospirota bacterium]